MQKVERQKHKDRRRKRLTWVVLCAVLLAVCVTAGLLLKKEAGIMPDYTKRETSGSIINRSEDELKSMTVTRRGKAPWTLIRDEDGCLRLLYEGKSDPEPWTVDDSIGRHLADAAVNLTYEDVYTENREEWEPAAEAFGLDDPAVSAVFRYTDGTEITALIGHSSDPEGNSVYYMTVDGDDRLFAVSAGTVQDLDVDQELFHPVTRLEILSELLDRITVRDSDGNTRMEWALQGQITDRDAAENWLLTAPYVYPADYDVMKNMRDNAANLKLGVYIGEADEETLQRYGLKQPKAVIEMHMAAGSTGTVSDAGVYDVIDREEHTVTLTVGSDKSETMLYVLFQDEIYTITRFLLNVFLDTDPLSTVARYAVATPLNSLDSVTVEKQGEETVRYALEQTDIETTEEGEAAGDSRRCTRNGEEIPYDAFEAAWERLLTVTVSGKLPTDYQPGEAHTRYTFRTVSGGIHTLELSDFDRMHDAVTMDGYTLFYLVKDGMTDLPSVPDA